MDILGFLTDASVRDISSSAILVVVVVLILTGRLVPLRQLRAARAETEAWHEAHAVSEQARTKLAQENYKLLETARISNQFYRDFLPAIDENTQPRHKTTGGG
jgi:hypothetical protein